MDVVLIAIIIIAVIAIIAIIAVLAYRADKLRTEAFKQFSQDLGFEFDPQGDAEFLNGLLAFHLFSNGHSKKLRNLMRGKTSNLEVAIFDYKSVTGHGKHRVTRHQTVICFRFAGPEIPTFSLRPETIWHKFGTWLGYQDIDFDSHPAFSRSYLLRSNNEHAIRMLFSDQVLEHYEQMPGLCTEGSGNKLLYYRHSRQVKPQELRQFMEEGFKVFAVFKLDQQG